MRLLTEHFSCRSRDLLLLHTMPTPPTPTALSIRNYTLHVITLLFILTLHRMLSLVTFFFRGRWGQIPRDIPVPEVRMVSTPNGTIRVCIAFLGTSGRRRGW